jgi:hypothetical protein
VPSVLDGCFAFSIISLVFTTVTNRSAEIGGSGQTPQVRRSPEDKHGKHKTQYTVAQNRGNGIDLLSKQADCKAAEWVEAKKRERIQGQHAPTKFIGDYRLNQGR